MGLAVADNDNDVDLDLFFSGMVSMVLLQNKTSQGSPAFGEVSTPAGVNHDSISLLIQDTALVGPLNVFLPAIWKPD
jgi:hypothetical protein